MLFAVAAVLGVVGSVVFLATTSPIAKGGIEAAAAQSRRTLKPRPRAGEDDNAKPIGDDSASPREDGAAAADDRRSRGARDSAAASAELVRAAEAAAG
jgi:hypothetical protein